MSWNNGMRCMSLYILMPPPPPNTLDIDDSGGNSCSLSDVAECSIILDENTPPRNFYVIAIPFTRQETLGYLASRIQYPL